MSMIEKLQARLEARKKFDGELAEKVNATVTLLEGEKAHFTADTLSTDKSVKAHIKEKSRKINGAIDRCIRDLKKALDEEDTEDTEETEVTEDGGNK